MTQIIDMSRPASVRSEPLPATSRLRMTHLGLRQFRNYREERIECDGRPICLHGPNGSGKTNMLEALSLLTAGRGLRGAALADLTREEAGPDARWEIVVSLAGDDETPRRLGMSLDMSQGRAKRRLTLDGTAIAPQDLSGLFAPIWLTPAHDRLFMGARSERRRFLDRQTFVLWPDHGQACAGYERAMRERNSIFQRFLLSESAWLDRMEARMAETGAIIATRRAATIISLRRVLSEWPVDNFPAPDITLEGEFDRLALEGATQDDLETAISLSLAKNRKNDAAAMRTRTGIHRSDLNVVHHQKKRAAAKCSTGEQKALLISLVLATARAFLERDVTRLCLLLLDDAVVHLDSDRRASLYDHLTGLRGGQSWLSGTDRHLFDAFFDRAQVFAVSEGRAGNKPDAAVAARLSEQG